MTQNLYTVKMYHPDAQNNYIIIYDIYWTHFREDNIYEYSSLYMKWFFIKFTMSSNNSPVSQQSYILHLEMNFIDI